MPRWILQCKNCDFAFTHSHVSESLTNYFEPPKPEFSAEAEHECPNCGHKATYQRTDLMYRL
jgi:rubredoxin